MIVQKRYAFSRNHTSNLEFLSFPGLYWKLDIVLNFRIPSCLPKISNRRLDVLNAFSIYDGFFGM